MTSSPVFIGSACLSASLSDGLFTGCSPVRLLALTKGSGHYCAAGYRAGSGAACTGLFSLYGTSTRWSAFRQVCGISCLITRSHSQLQA